MDSVHNSAIETVEPLNAAGYELIPVTGKRPVGRWRASKPLDLHAALQRITSGENVGVRLRSTDLVIDVDPRNGGNESWEKLQAMIALPDAPMVLTGGDGLHVYLRKPSDVLIRTQLPDLPGVEFKTVGAQVVAPGSIHPVTGKKYGWDVLAMAPPGDAPDAPHALLAMLRRDDADKVPSEAGGVEPHELEDMLGILDVEDFRSEEDWRTLMMACHHATDGLGLDEFLAWSMSDPAYADHGAIITRRWQSLQAGKPGGVTKATLFKLLIEKGRGDLIPRSSALEDFADVEGLEDEGAPFHERYVWVAEADRFVRRSDRKKMTTTAWKSLYAGQWPEGDILAAVWKGKLEIRRCESLVFIPYRPEFLDGGRTFNIWAYDGVQEEPGDVSIFLDHVAYLVPDEPERDMLLDYLAMLVKLRGQKINYALLLQGEGGTGKTWIGQLMKLIIGRRNVSEPSNDEVGDKWTAWMEGAELAILEELMSPGAQKLKIANKLKPVITGDTLRIEDKGQPLYSIPNHLNLICFTNFRDALAVADDDDRRWLVIFSPAKPRDWSYYAKLFGYLDGMGPAHVKQWLLERQIGLSPTGRAPYTLGKKEMHDETRSEAEQVLQETYDARDWPFDFSLVRFEDAIAAVRSAGLQQSELTRLRSRVGRFFQKIGALKHPRYTGKGRPSYQLWSINEHERWEAAGAAGRVDAYNRHAGINGEDEPD